MSVKSLDRCNRWRSKTVAFRMSPEENALLDSYVQLSGMTKQDYIIARLLHKDVIVQGNPRVFKALRNQLDALYKELQRVQSGNRMEQDGMDRMEMIVKIMEGMKEDSNARK